MSSCFGRTFNLHKFFIANKVYTSKPFSVLSYYNHSNIFRDNYERHSCRKVYGGKQTQQYRNFSANEIAQYNSKLFEAITSSEASKLIKELVIQVHDVSGLPWWTTIVFAGLGMKLGISLPFGIYQQYLISKIKLTKLELDALSDKIKEEVLLAARRGKWTALKANAQILREKKKLWSVLVVKNNCHPFKCVIINNIQIPIWLLFSLTLRKFSIDFSGQVPDSILAALQFQVGGPFWCHNLILPDPTLALPTVIFLSSLATYEISLLYQTSPVNFLSKLLRNVLRVFIVASFFLSSALPASVSLFWATTSVFGLLQNLLFLSPRFRRFFRIPKTPSDPDRPYIEVAHKFKTLFSKLRTFWPRK